MSMKNKTALITGAASGIGKGCAVVLSRLGANIVVADINIDNALETAREIVEQGGVAVGVRMDVTNEAEVNYGVEFAVATFGGIDILVSNAGIQIINPIEKYSYADWKKMLAIHLDGAFLATKAVISHMYNSGKGGAIIYMGSVHSHEASKLKSAYVTAKHGLIGLCKAIAKEAGDRNVSVNVVCPGYVYTPLVEKQIPEQAKELGISNEAVIKNIMLKETVDGEFTSVEDVANTVAFLAGIESNAITGQSIIVSHGWYMQ